MKHSFIDKYSNLNSLVHKLDPRTKIISFFAFIIFVITTSHADFIQFTSYATVILLVILLSKVPLIYIIKRVYVIIPFVVFVAIFVPFMNETQDGFRIFWNVLIKSFLAILATIMLSSTTKFPELLHGFELLKLPKILILILSFMYRYIFVLTDEAGRMERARSSRYFGGEYLRQARIIGNIIGLLFIRAYERGERVYQSMVARGFDGEIITMNKTKFSSRDIYFFMIFMGSIIVIKLWSIF